MEPRVYYKPIPMEKVPLRVYCKGRISETEQATYQIISKDGFYYNLVWTSVYCHTSIPWVP